MATLAMTSKERDLRTWDGIVVFWVVLWIVMGAAIGVTIWSLSGLADSAVESGRALDNAGQALEGLGRIPVIGEGPGTFGSQVRTTATGIVANGEQAGRSIHTLAVLLGVTIAVVPSIPVFGFYLPFRLARRRDVAQVRAALGREGWSPTIQGYLAGRAAVHLNYERVSAALAAGTDDASPSTVEALARAELDWLGLRPAGRSADVQ
jgi:hypothetical protein